MAYWDQPQIMSGYINQPQNMQGKPKVAICILHTGSVSIKWAMRTALLFSYLSSKNIFFSYLLSSNQPYDNSREMLTRSALQGGAEYIFHYDTDCLIPLNSIELMIEWAEKYNLPVISGLYWAKKPGEPMPAAWFKTKEYPEENKIDFAPLDIKKSLEKNPGKQPIIPVDVTGAGCLLVKREVFEKLDKSDPDSPYFLWGLGRNYKCPKCGSKGPLPQMSEDFYFCTRCVKELNIKPHLATAIRCDHLAEVKRRGEDGVFELHLGMV